MEEKKLLEFKKGRNNKSKKVHCPCCTNRRLMDMVSVVLCQEKVQIKMRKF